MEYRGENAIGWGSSNTVDCLSTVVVDFGSDASNGRDSYSDPAKGCNNSCEIVTLKVWANAFADG